MTDYRKEFFDFDNVVYLDVSGQGPLPRVASQALRRAIEWKEQPQKMPADMYFGLPDRVRGQLARVIGARPNEIAVTTGATTGLAAVANGIDWRADDEVLIAEREFPAHFSVFCPLAERGWLRIVPVRPRGRFLSADDYIACIGPRTRLVSASLVRFHDGTRIDARRLADACHSVGAWLLLDASQCVGAMPFEPAALGADFLASSGYKWLLGPYGTGFFWVREERIAELRPAPFYWTALPGAHEFNSLDLSPYRPDPTARRWDTPETASLNLVAWEASLEFLLRVGVETVWRHNQERIGELLEKFPRDRCVLASPADQNGRGPYVSLAARTPEKTKHLHGALREAQVIVSLRENALRIAPHLFTTVADIDRLVSLLTI